MLIFLFFLQVEKIENSLQRKKTGKDFGPRLGIWVGGLHLPFACFCAFVSALGVSSFFYIPAFSFWVGAFS